MIWLLIDTRGVGGAERHVAGIAAALGRIGIDAEAVLYAGYGSNPWVQQLAIAGVRWRILGGSFFGLLAALLRHRPTILHTHGYKAGILGRIAAMFAGVRVVSTFHSGERFRFPVCVYEWIDAWTSFLGRRIAVSKQIAERLPFPSSVIPSFVTPAPANVDQCLPRRVAFIGRLSPEKAPELFCALARRAPPGLEWHVYGDGVMRRHLEETFGDIVQFHGVVVNLRDVWKDLGLVVMPSRFEGVPLAALEALAFGIPVLASRVGGLPSIVVDHVTGWLFEAGDVEHALAGLARWLAMSPQQQLVLRKSCLRHVEEAFSERGIMPKLLEVYATAGLPVRSSVLPGTRAGF